MRLEVNTSGAWKVICYDVPADQVDVIRDACETIANVAMPKMMAWRLTEEFGKTRMAVDSLHKWPNERAVWKSRQ